jgi:endonuclease-3
MPTITNKQQTVSKIFSVLARGAKHADAEPRPVLEQFLYAICREGVTREQADQAYRALQEQFFDWNEVRVSSIRELAEVLDMLPEPETRAQRLVDFLQEVFETTYSFDLEGLQKKGVKQAAKQLARYQAANDYAVASVIQNSLGGHAIPLDEPSSRCLRRLGLIDVDGDPETLRGGVEHQIPKARGPLFGDLISELAQEYCWDDDPRCSSCPLCSACPTGQDHKATVSASSGRHKPR